MEPGESTSFAVLRERSGLSLDETASFLGFSVDQARRLEAGLERASARHLQVLRGLGAIGGISSVAGFRSGRLPTAECKLDVASEGSILLDSSAPLLGTSSPRTEADAISLARAFAQQAVNVWWRQLAARMRGAHRLRPCDVLPIDLPTDLFARAESIGRAAAELP